MLPVADADRLQPFNILLDLWGDDDFFNAPRLRIINVRGIGYKLIVE